MSASTEPLASQNADLPPLLRADLAGPAIVPSSWVWTIGPAYAGLFVWVPFHDRLGTSLLSAASPGWLAASAVLAVLACYSLLYYVPAVWGLQAGQPLSVVAASTFGTTGSEWITGILVGLAAVVWFAVAIAMGLRMTFLGLLDLGLISPLDITPRPLGAITVESPVVLVTAVFWIFILGMASLLRLPGVIISLMQVYTPVALLLLGLTALLASPGLGSFEQARQALWSNAPELRRAGSGGPETFQLVFGGFAFSGLLAVEWGRGVRGRRDVRIGGWISVLCAGSFCTIMSLLTVAGSLERTWAAVPAPWPVLGSFHGAVALGLGGIPSGIILLLFGLAALAPGCYAVHVFGQRFSAHWPRLRRFYWTWLGGLAAFGLIATAWATELEAMLCAMGAVFAPAVGAITADALWHRGKWSGIRRGWNPPGLVAWAVGVLIGSLPAIGARWDQAVLRDFQPASLYGYVAAAAIYSILALLGLQRPLLPLPAAGTAGEDASSIVSEVQAAAGGRH